MHAMQRLQTNKGAGRPPPTPIDPRKKEQAVPAVQLQQRNQSNTVLHTHIHANEMTLQAHHADMHHTANLHATQNVPISDRDSSQPN